MLLALFMLFFGVAADVAHAVALTVAVDAVAVTVALAFATNAAAVVVNVPWHIRTILLSFVTVDHAVAVLANY